MHTRGDTMVWIEEDRVLFTGDVVMSQRFLAAEIVREKIMRQLGDELPYAITVQIEEFAQDGDILHISALIFVEPTQSERARQALRGPLGGRRLEYLLELLAFIRAAHFWTVVHPGLEIEDDVRELMNTHKELAYLLLQDPDLR